MNERIVYDKELNAVGPASEIERFRRMVEDGPDSEFDLLEAMKRVGRIMSKETVEYEITDRAVVMASSTEVALLNSSSFSRMIFDVNDAGINGKRLVRLDVEPRIPLNHKLKVAFIYDNDDHPQDKTAPGGAGTSRKK